MTNVGDFFKAFKEAGAVPVDPSETGESSSGARAFSGGGFRLGSDETPSTKVSVHSDGLGLAMNNELNDPFVRSEEPVLHLRKKNPDDSS